MKKRNKKKYAYGQVIGAGMQIGDMIGGPIRQRAEEIDPNTGEYVNYNKAVRNAAAGSIWAPHKAITESLNDPNATGAEKALSFTSLMGIPGLSKLWANKRYSRLEEEHEKEAWNNKYPSVSGASYNPYYMAQGGIAGEYAELEDGEPFMTPDGNIEMVNGRTHAEGGEDFMLPNGTAILGKNRSKIYNEKFKELGAKLKKAQDKHEKILDSKASPIARRSSLLMLDRIEKEFNDLVQEQEMEKLSASNEQFAKGGIYIKPENRGKFNATKRRTGKTTEELTHSKNPLTRKRAIFAQNAAKWKHTYGARIGYDDPSQFQLQRPAAFGLTQPNMFDIVNNMTQQRIANNNVVPTTTKKTTTPRVARPELLKPLTPIASTGVTPTTSAPGITRTVDYASQMPTSTKGNFASSLGTTASTLGQLAPIMYNIGQGMFGKTEDYNYNKYTNPYIGSIRSTMRNRRYNIDPQLEANRLTQAAYNRNLSQAGASPSQLYANMLAGVSGRQRADAAAYAEMQNMNNQYLGQQAEMDYNLGRDVSGLKQYGYEANLRNRAAKRNYMSTGLTQLQQYAQVQELMKNQKISDKQKLNLLKDIIPNFFYNEELGYELKNK